MPWIIQHLDEAADVSAFDCGERSLNTFLQRHAPANDRAGLGRTFIAIEQGQTRVAGFVTVSTGTVRFDAIPQHASRRLPKYPIPTVHIGRLAVDLAFQKRGLGELLLVKALSQAAAAADEIGIYAVDVIALHEQARTFYLRYGFVEMLDQPLHLFLPIATARLLAGMTER